MAALAIPGLLAVAAASCLVASVSHADEVVSMLEDNYVSKLLPAYARAAGLRPLDEKSGDQVRIWYDEPMYRGVLGTVITRDGAWRCNLDTENDGEKFTVREGRCKRLSRTATRVNSAMNRLAEALEFDGKELSCEVEDGWVAQVEGSIGGRRFEFAASNTGFCDDPGVKRVENWLRAVGGIYWKE